MENTTNMVARRPCVTEVLTDCTLFTSHPITRQREKLIVSLPETANKAAAAIWQVGVPACKLKRSFLLGGVAR